MRLRLDLAYDGSAFDGWAIQPRLRTVQGELEHALALILRQDRVALTCAGRTDSGVHARGQVVHLDVPSEAVTAAAGRARGPAVPALVRRLNSLLQSDLSVLAGSEAPAGFDARFSALWRRYAYRVADRPEVVDPLVRGHVITRRRELDLALMNLAARELLGEHDFAAYCRKRVGATTRRELLTLEWRREADGLAVATVRADAFCRSMVRSLVGALIAVGEGRRAPDWPAELLAAGVRNPTVTVAPAHGLCLEEVAYPPDAEVAARARQTRVVRSRG